MVSMWEKVGNSRKAKSLLSDMGWYEMTDLTPVLSACGSVMVRGSVILKNSTHKKEN